jgi:hypothetical protein
MGKIPDRTDAEKWTRPAVPLLREGPGVEVPPAGLFPILRGRLLMSEAEQVVWEVAVALLCVPAGRWNDYRVVLKNVPVPGSACTRRDFGTVMREWWLVRAAVWWSVEWAPFVLVALVGLVETLEGASWAEAILRGFCRRQMALVAPPGRQRQRPPYEAQHRTEDFLVAWERAHHHDRHGRLDGRVNWSRVLQNRAKVGIPDLGDCGITDPEEKLRTNYLRRGRTLLARGGTPA